MDLNKAVPHGDADVGGKGSPTAYSETGYEPIESTNLENTQSRKTTNKQSP